MIAPSLLEQIADAHSKLAELYRAAGASNDSATGDKWIDQRNSPLGPRRHIERVRALVAIGSPDATISGRRYLLRESALATGNPLQKPAPKQHDELATLRARYTNAEKRAS